MNFELITLSLTQNKEKKLFFAQSLIKVFARLNFADNKKIMEFCIKVFFCLENSKKERNSLNSRKLNFLLTMKIFNGFFNCFLLFLVEFFADPPTRRSNHQLAPALAWIQIPGGRLRIQMSVFFGKKF